jgi:hypothetical protein
MEPAVDFAVRVVGTPARRRRAPQSSPARSALSYHPPEERLFRREGCSQIEPEAVGVALLEAE